MPDEQGGPRKGYIGDSTGPTRPGMTADGGRSNEGYVRPKRRPESMRWEWVTWLEDDGTRVAHFAPSTGEKRSTAVCGIGAPYYATALNEIDVDVDETCDECRERREEVS